MPLVSRTFDQLIDFTRTSSATFVGSNGLIQSTPASRNLLTFTQELVSGASWGDSIGGTGVAPTLTANAAAAPDGTMTADRLQFSLAGGTALADLTRRRQTYTTPATTHTFSIYLRSTDGSSSYNMHIVGPTGATTNIVVDGTWQRFTVTGAGAGAVVTYAVGLRGAQSPANSNTADVLAWGAQLETGSTATDYTRNFGGLFPPRFDYDPVTLAPRGLLIEEQRTNLMLRSEEFDNAAWTKQATGTGTLPVVTANAAVAPDGTMTADQIVFDKGVGTTINDQSNIRASVSTTQVTTHSIWLRASAPVTIVMRNPLNNGTYSQVDVTTAWQRVTFTSPTAPASATVFEFGLRASVGVVVPDTATVFAWGAQLEAGDFATSYIPTVASQVTRTADTALIQAPNFAPWYRQNAGTFVVEAELAAIPAGATTGRFLEAFSPGSVDRQPLVYATNTGLIGVSQMVASVGQAFLAPGTMVAGQPFKLAGCYRTNDFAASLNAGAVVTDTSGTVASNITSLAIGYGPSSPNDRVPTHIRSIRYYPVRLSNAQLQALTA